MAKKVIIAGGAGFIGTRLSRELLFRGYEVICIDIHPSRVPGVTSCIANLLEGIPANEYLERPFAVINLVGKNIFGRWNEVFKRDLYDSRIIGTEKLIALFQEPRYQPTVFLGASAVGYYGDRGNEELTERSSRGRGFLTETVVDWEHENFEAERLHIRTVIMRNGNVLGRGGLLSQVVPIYRWFLGGPLGTGKQWFPWIHISDLVALYIFTLEHHEIEGIVNVVAPEIITQGTFSRTLATIMKRPYFFDVPKWVLKILFKEFGEEILASQKVVSRQAQTKGFTFQFPTVEMALKEILKA